MRIEPVLGIRVRYEALLPVISDSGGVWPRKRISVGPAFFALSTRQQGAVLLHEAGHCKLFHTEKMILRALRSPRLLWAVLVASCAAARRFKTQSSPATIWFQTEVERLAPGTAAYRQAQERQADAYAAGCGYGPDLAQVFGFDYGPGGPFHPPAAARIAALIGDGRRLI